MSLRARLLFVMGIAILLVIVLSRVEKSAVQHFMVMDETVEQEATVRRVQATVSYELDNNLAVTIGWGDWDGFYDAVLGCDGRFLEENFSSKVVVDLEANYLVIYDRDGTLLQTSGESVDIPNTMYPVLKNSPLPVSGVFVDSEGLNCQLHAVAIRKSDGSGDPAGVLVVVRPLERSGRWMEVIGASLTPTADAEGLAYSVEVPLRQQDILTGQIVRPTVYMDPYCAHRIVYPAISKAFVWVWIGVVLMIISIAVLIELIIFRPIRRIAAETIAIADARDSNRRLPAIGSGGEVRGLRIAVNALLACSQERLEDKKASIASLEKKTGELLEALQEVERQQRQLAMQARIAGVAELAAGIAHNVNNALSIIVGYIELTTIEVARGDVKLPEHVVARLHAITASADTIKGVVAGLRKLYRDTERDVQMKPTDVNGLVSEVHEMMRASLYESGVKSASLHLDKRDLFTLTLQGELRDAVVNLIKNAMEAVTEDDGSVEVATQLVDDESGQWIDITVRDNGIGMDEATVLRCTDYWFTTKPDGNGVGLATVAGTAQRHNGSLDIVSRLNHGTAVTLRLPLLSVEEEVMAQSAGASAWKDGLRILHAEDEKDIRILVDEYLTKQGFTVVGVPNAQDAITALESEDPEFDLVITDLAMPGERKGDAVARLAHEMGLPVVIMTGYGQVAEGVPHDRLVSKPFTFRHLMRAVNAALSSTDRVSQVS